jgi:hypothetical protein
MVVSKNGVALLVFALTYVGLDISENMILDVISAIGQIVSFVLLVANQLERKDVKGFLWKRW